MIVVTGGAGAMGKRLVKRLIERGRDVAVVGLPGDPGAKNVEALGARYFGADIRDVRTLQPAFEGAKGVVHLAAIILARKNPELLHQINVDGTRNVVEAARSAGVSRFVHISSISVEYFLQNPYSESKRLAEDVIRRSDLDWTILRPTLAWGDSSAAEYATFARVVERSPVLPLPAGGKALKSPVHLDDLANAFADCIDSSAVSRRTLSLPGPEKISLAEMAKAIRVARSTRGLTVFVPSVPAGWLVRMHASLWRSIGLQPMADRQTWTGLVENAIPDIGPAMIALGWTPRRFDPFLDGLRGDPAT